jgi:hypothetical protein
LIEKAEAVEYSDGAMSHIVGRNFGRSGGGFLNEGKEAVKLNLHINNYEIDVMARKKQDNSGLTSQVGSDLSHEYVVKTIKQTEPTKRITAQDLRAP